MGRLFKGFRKKNKTNSSYQNIDLVNDPDDAAAAESPPRMTKTSDSYNENSFYDESIGSSSISHPSHSFDSEYEKDDGDDGSNVGDENDDDTQSHEASLDDLPHLISQIKSCSQTYSLKPAKALRLLFALSENDGFQEINRIRMVREADGELLPTLFTFLQRCEPSSSEQYLALLVLNNVSIPKENKRLVAIESNGAYVLSRLLCDYPNIPLICIILVNLSFCDSNLRKELVDDLYKEIQLVEALAYALKVSIRSKRYNLSNQISSDDGTKQPQQMLDELIKSENLTKKYTSNTSQEDEHHNHHDELMMGSLNNLEIPFHSDDVTFPETARWALCGMKNLTRPPCCKDVGHKLIQEYDIVPILLQTLNVEESQEFTQDPQGFNIGTEIIRNNDPYMWDSNSMQDTALYMLMNLAISQTTQPYLNKNNVGNAVSLVAKYSSSLTSHSSTGDEEKQKDLQCLKARMILAYLFGSYGHFGQDRGEPSTLNDDDENKDHSSELLIKGSEAVLVVELLANSLHSRGKPGAGGYNATTFNPKKVLSAIRCLLTNKFNVKTLHVTCGVKLNALLFKAIALHTIKDVVSIDPEAAEDACFSLYLLSNHGFMSPFLPPPGEGFPFYQVIHHYFHKESCSIAGKHAAKQLMLRTSYLNFEGSLFHDDEPQNIDTSDMELEDALLYAAAATEVEKKIVGAEPLDDIFGRPLTRRKRNLPQYGLEPEECLDTLGFNSALDAVQAFSLGSNQAQNPLEIDDVEIANNIAMCANDNQAVESYGYKWAWEDGEIQEQEVRSKLDDFRRRKIEGFRGLLKTVKSEGIIHEPITLFGFKCGGYSNVVD